MTILEPLSKLSAESKTVSVLVYKPQNKSVWDSFVSSSKNGTFISTRDYLEYHSDRFTGHSLLFFRKGRLVALLPANIKDDVLYSHGGLTFGES